MVAVEASLVEVLVALAVEVLVVLAIADEVLVAEVLVAVDDEASLVEVSALDDALLYVRCNEALHNEDLYVLLYVLHSEEFCALLYVLHNEVLCVLLYVRCSEALNDALLCDHPVRPPPKQYEDRNAQLDAVPEPNC
jgi:hypothetical protein